MNDKSDTPRTELAIREYDKCGVSRDLIRADFARQLERRARAGEALLQELMDVCYMDIEHAPRAKIGAHLAACKAMDEECGL